MKRRLQVILLWLPARMRCMEPGNGKREGSRHTRLLKQGGCLLGIGEPEIKPGKEIRVGVRCHSPAINLSARRVWARVNGFGNSFASRARKSGPGLHPDR